MTYKAPRAFAIARPHLAMVLGDDPASSMREYMDRKDPQGRITPQKLLEQGTKLRRLSIAQYTALKGMEAVAWEMAAGDTVQALALMRDVQYVRVSGRPPISDMRIDALSKIDGAMHVELDDVTAMLPGGAPLHGVTIVHTPQAMLDEHAERAVLTFTLWPRVGAGDWAAQRAIGHHFGVASNTRETMLLDAMRESTVNAAAKLAAEGFGSMLDSKATTTWSDDMANIIAIHAQAAIAALRQPGPETWQDGIPPYLLAKTEGPKGAAAAAALIRRGFVRERHINMHDAGNTGAAA